MADITDGTSTTIIMGESIYPQGVWSQATTSVVRTNIDRTINKPIIVNVNGVNVTYWTYWASKHPSAVNFAYCDGSVRPVTSQINKLVLHQAVHPQRRRDDLERRDEVIADSPELGDAAADQKSTIPRMVKLNEPGIPGC